MAILRDVRYALRLLLRRPGFSLVSVLVLCLGIGATTAVFSVVYDVLLDPLPYPRAEELVMVWNQKTRQEEPRLLVSPPEYLDYAASDAFRLAAYHTWDFTLTGGGEPERITGAAATASLFPVLGAEARVGRLFGDDDDRPGHEYVAVLAYDFWQRRFGGDRSAVGRELILDGSPYEIIGVAAPTFQFPEPEVELWVPLALDPATMPGRKAHQLSVVGRLSDGVSLPEARAEMEALAARMPEEYPDVYPPDSGWNVDVEPLYEEVVGDVRPALLLLLGAVGLVLLIACVNVANLLLVHSVSRSREVAVRLALGSGRRRLFAQFLVESLLLSLSGGVLGLVLGLGVSRALAALAGRQIPRLESVELEPAVLVFALAVSVLTGVAFGLVPALRSSRNRLTENLKDAGRGGAIGGGRSALRAGLVVLEVALSLVLLVGAGLMVKSFFQLQQVDTGFRAEGVLVGELGLPYAKYPDSAEYREFFQRLRREVEAIPGVEAAGAMAVPPFGSELMWSGEAVPQRTRGEVLEGERVDIFVTTEGSRRALGIPLMAGRFVSRRDTAEAPPVVVVGERFARRWWPQSQAVGERIKLGGPDSDEPWMEVVGVVADVKREGLDVESKSQLYIPMAQAPFRWPGLMGLVVRTSGDPRALIPTLRSRLHELDPDQPFATLSPLEERVSATLVRQRFVLWLLIGFAVLAMSLAAVGLYGVLSYLVSQRTGEFGLRMALGAQRSSVLWHIVGQGMVLTAVGLGLGLVAAFLLTRLMATLLFEVSTTDPLVYGAVTLFLAVIAFVACQIPALRATRVSPVEALRYE